MEDVAAYRELKKYGDSSDSSISDSHFILKDLSSVRDHDFAAGSDATHAIRDLCKEEGNSLTDGEGDDFVPRAAVARGAAPCTVRNSDVLETRGTKRKVHAIKNPDRHANFARLGNKHTSLNPSDYFDSDPSSSSSSSWSQSSFEQSLHSSPCEEEGKHSSENRSFFSEAH